MRVSENIIWRRRIPRSLGEHQSLIEPRRHRALPTALNQLCEAWFLDLVVQRRPVLIVRKPALKTPERHRALNETSSVNRASCMPLTCELGNEGRAERV